VAVRDATGNIPYPNCSATCTYNIDTERTLALNAYPDVDGLL
jgi:hypothetical protein